MIDGEEGSSKDDNDNNDNANNDNADECVDHSKPGTEELFKSTHRAARKLFKPKATATARARRGGGALLRSPGTGPACRYKAAAMDRQSKIRVKKGVASYLSSSGLGPTPKPMAGNKRRVSGKGPAHLSFTMV